MRTCTTAWKGLNEQDHGLASAGLGEPRTEPRPSQKLLTLPAGCRGLGWLPLPSSRSPVLNLILSWWSALLQVSGGHFSSMDHFPHLKNSTGLDWNALWHPVPVQGSGLQGGCALAGWCFTASAASVRDGYLYVPALLIPRKCHLDSHHPCCT